MTINSQQCITAIFPFKLLTFQIIASAFRPHMDFTTSRLADISVARRKEAAARAGAAEHQEGRTRGNLLQSGEARVLPSLVFPPLGASRPASGWPGWPRCRCLTQHSQHSRAAAAPPRRAAAAGGSSKRRQPPRTYRERRRFSAPSALPSRCKPPASSAHPANAWEGSVLLVVERPKNTLAAAESRRSKTAVSSLLTEGQNRSKPGAEERGLSHPWPCVRTQEEKSKPVLWLKGKSDSDDIQTCLCFKKITSTQEKSRRLPAM